MKIIFILMFTVFGLYAAASAEKYKIYVETFETEAASEEAMIILEKDPNMIYLKKKYGFSIFKRPLNEFFVVGLGPFENKTIVLHVLDTVQDKNRDALVIKIHAYEEDANRTIVRYPFHREANETVSNELEAEMISVPKIVNEEVNTTEKEELLPVLEMNASRTEAVLTEQSEPENEIVTVLIDENGIEEEIVTIAVEEDDPDVITVEDDVMPLDVKEEPSLKPDQSVSMDRPEYYKAGYKRKTLIAEDKSPETESTTEVERAVSSDAQVVKKAFLEENLIIINLILMAVIVILLLALIMLISVLLKRKKITENDTDLSRPLMVDRRNQESNKVQVRDDNQLLVDLHSHLIPGIDDGSKSMEDSIAMILKLQSLGYKKLITTPHTMSHRFPNTSEIILSGLEELKRELSYRNIDIEIEAASEYYLDEHFLELIEKGDILTFNGNYLLFEMSYMQPPINMEDIIFRIKVAGYQPVLAHPERYRFLYSDFEKYEQIKDMGVLFQLNINSLSGYYSKEAQKIALKLVEKGMIDFLGSDTHKSVQLDNLEKVKQTKQYKQIFHNNTILNNTLLRVRERRQS